MADIEEFFAAKNVQPRQGDILFVRTGFVSAYKKFDEENMIRLKSGDNTWPGLEQSEAMARWLWKRQFAAIAADNPALECIRE